MHIFLVGTRPSQPRRQGVEWTWPVFKAVYNIVVVDNTLEASSWRAWLISCHSFAEHRAYKKQRQRTRLAAKASTSPQFVPPTSDLNCSSPGLPLFLCPRGFQLSVCFSTASRSLHRVLTIHWEFRFLIWRSIHFSLAVAHKNKIYTGTWSKKYLRLMIALSKRRNCNIKKSLSHTYKE